jgi:hypothetical protein
MAKKVYKIRDTATNKYWNGQSHRSVFNNDGKVWSNRARCEASMTYFIQYRSRWATSTNPFNPPTTWEIVEIELQPVEKTTYDTVELLKTIVLRNKVSSVHTSFGYFIDTMSKKNVLDKIEFMFKIKPTPGMSYVDFDRIKEARAQLRQLGVKTRTFKEHNGVFGMMDRQQALKARLVLDIEHSIDLPAVRTELKI